MTMKSRRELACPKCSHEQQVMVWSTVNSMDKEASQLVRDMKLNIFHCEACGNDAFIDENVLYHDMEHKYVVQYVSLGAFGNEAFYKHITKRGTLIIDPISTSILAKTDEDFFTTPHFVFSTREMAAYIVFRELCAEWGAE
jgi:hypothetical protein